MVASVRFELTHVRVKVIFILAARAGFEPAHHGVKVRCVTASPSGNTEELL